MVTVEAVFTVGPLLCLHGLKDILSSLPYIFQQRSTQYLFHSGDCAVGCMKMKYKTWVSKDCESIYFSFLNTKKKLRF